MRRTVLLSATTPPSGPRHVRSSVAAMQVFWAGSGGSATSRAA
jgi:hypothetical protein